MVSLNHQSARDFLQQAADGDLVPEAEASLQGHLAECAACRAYAEELRVLEIGLTRALSARWDERKRTPARIRSAAPPRSFQWLNYLVQAGRPFAQVSSLMIAFAFLVAMMQAYRFPQAAPSHSSTPAVTFSLETMRRPSPSLSPVVERRPDLAVQYPEAEFEQEDFLSSPSLKSEAQLESGLRTTRLPWLGQLTAD